MYINFNRKENIKKKKRERREKDSIEFRKNLKTEQEAYTKDESINRDVSVWIKEIIEDKVVVEYESKDYTISLNELYPYPLNN